MLCKKCESLRCDNCGDIVEPETNIINANPYRNTNQEFIDSVKTHSSSDNCDCADCFLDNGS